MSDGRSTPFTVVYSDGETETNVGILRVYPTSSMKTLLSILSKKVGIFPHLFTVFLAKQGTNLKIPLSSKTNFAGISNKSGEYYLYVKKKNSSIERLVVDDGSQFAAAPSTLEMERRISNEVEALRKATNSDRAVCIECLIARLSWSVADFHLCLLDEIVVGFKTSAGPISRPVRNSGENGRH